MAVNDELTWEILSRLPPKSVIRFKIVCKRWMSLTSRPAFVADHIRRRRSGIPDLVVLHSDRSSRPKPTDESPNTAFSLDGGDDATALLPDPSLSSIKREFGVFPRTLGEFRGTVFKMWNSCNGLLLIGLMLTYSKRDPPRGQLLVVNPTTMETKDLGMEAPWPAYGGGVLFDPSVSPHRYRVVSLGRRSGYRNPPMTEFATYYSEKDAWESNCKTSLSLNSCGLHSEGRGVFWNGMLNWVNNEGDGRGSLLSFDAERQLLHKAPLPLLPDGFYRNILSFRESGGRLLLIEAHGFGDPYGADIWFSGVSTMCFDIKEMDAQSLTWSLLYHVDLAGAMIENLFPNIYVPVYPDSEQDRDKLLALWPVLVVPRENAEEEDVLLLSMRDEIVAYGLRSNTFRVVHTIAPVKRPWGAPKPVDVFSYNRTLFSP